MNLPESGINDLKKTRVFLTGAFLIIFFSVGVFGIAADETREMFIMLTPLALIFSLAAIIAFHHPGNLKKEIIIFTAIFSVSFLIEALGVNTGRVFGNHTMAKVYGSKYLTLLFLSGLTGSCLYIALQLLQTDSQLRVSLRFLSHQH